MFTFTNTMLAIAAGCILLAMFGCMHPAIGFAFAVSWGLIAFSSCEG